MKVKYGGGIVDARGSLAGNTYSRNHYGAYVRARTSPINPNTGRQQTVKNAVAFIADRWANVLTAAQRAAWDLYGSSVAMLDSMGSTMYLTGYNHYIRSNVPLKQTGAALIDPGPTVFELPAHDPTLSFGVSEATQNFTVNYDDTMDYADEDGGRMFLFGGKPQNAQRNFFGGPFRYYGQVIGVNGAPPASPHVGASGYIVAEGQHIWIQARISRADGRLSEPFRADSFCLA